ncbi:hypothetical protein Tco_0463697, partial [Tanacetum coccineum]
NKTIKVSEEDEAVASTGRMKGSRKKGRIWKMVEKKNRWASALAGQECEPKIAC